MHKNLKFIAIGLAALALGVGFAVKMGTAPAANPAIESLFVSKIVNVDGKTFPIESYRGAPLLINVWAPWCAPCVEELPELSALATSPDAKGVKFVGLGVDNAQNISDFGIRHPVSFPLVVAGTLGTALAKALDNKAGALPFTVLIDAKGQVVAQKTGRVHADEVKAWIAKLK